MESAQKGLPPLERLTKDKLIAHDFSTLDTHIAHNSKITCRHAHNLDLTITDKVFRLYFQNFNNITLNNNGAEFRDEMTVLKKMGYSLIPRTEPNNNWQRGDIYNRARNTIGLVWNKNKFVVSHCKERTKTNLQPSGTFTLTMGKWVSKVISSRKDNLGRWSWVTFQGKQKDR
eukprot:14748684-Ditylum_brightwellii.AAC.1